jgi:hypothetical protein
MLPRFTNNNGYSSFPYPGHPKVVEHVVLQVLASLQPDVQRETLEALDPLGRSVLVMLATKYPELAAKVLDKYGTIKNTGMY